MFTALTTHTYIYENDGDFIELDHEPCDYIDPAMSEDGKTFAYAVEDNRYTPYDWQEGVEFIQGDRRVSRFNSDPESWAEGLKGTHDIFPVGVYDHSLIQYSLSGESIYSNDQFDYASVGGFIAIPKDFTNTKDAARGILEEYTNWCNGYVYGVIVMERNDDCDWLEVDSCFGYIGMEYTQTILKWMVRKVV